MTWSPFRLLGYSSGSSPIAEEGGLFSYKIKRLFRDELRVQKLGFGIPKFYSREHFKPLLRTRYSIHPK
jgi:hypothetical protein